MRELSLLIDKAEIKIRSIDENQARIAQLAFLQFGKGRHPAQLNFGNCFTYALAKTLDQPLLFKEEDVSKTGVKKFFMNTQSHQKVPGFALTRWLKSIIAAQICTCAMPH